ncbi:MAG: hypothetical protein IPG99_04150 [Ignavibacteria bacterium]|nr:hypothetical protein [Ignavibacteria bacterium]
MMRLLVILALAFFAVTFLTGIVRKIIKSGGLQNADRDEFNKTKEDKSKIIDAKYEEIK